MQGLDRWYGKGRNLVQDISHVGSQKARGGLSYDVSHTEEAVHENGNDVPGYRILSLHTVQVYGIQSSPLLPSPDVHYLI